MSVRPEMASFDTIRCSRPFAILNVVKATIVVAKELRPFLEPNLTFLDGH